MKGSLEYTTLKGVVISLQGLDAEELKLLDNFRLFLQSTPDWNAYRNYFMECMGDFSDRRKLKRADVIQSAVFRIGQDMGSRLAVTQGLARAPSLKPDYREQLSRIIREKYRTRRGFCHETGISEDLLSHVLAGRKNLAIDTLATALERIGYQIQIVPMGPADQK